MFERRLKILLGIILGFTLVLIFRAGWLQVVRAEEYRQKAADAGKRISAIETVRGAIKDYRGRTVAEDGPCIDACVDYRAIDLDTPESQAWLREQATARLKARNMFRGDKDERAKLVDGEVSRVKEDIRHMWRVLSEVSRLPPETIDQVRLSI